MNLLPLIPLFPLASAALLMLSTGRMPRRLAAVLGAGSVGLSALHRAGSKPRRWVTGPTWGTGA